MRRSALAVFFCAALLLVCSPGAFGTSVPDTGDAGEAPCNPRSFTDLGNGIVEDNVTGLMWQQLSAPDTYTFRDARAYVESLTLGGYDDWRLPTVQELSLLVDPTVKNPSPAINTAFFPDTRSDYYWSFTRSARGIWKAWAVDFSTGYVSYKGKLNTFYVRAVRGITTGSSLVDNGDGTVTDESTGLMWQQEDAPNTYTWKQAGAYCDNLTLSGYTDWRLPTRNELQTLIDYRRFSPALAVSISPRILDGYFPCTAWGPYWTSTANATSAGVAWYVNFLNGAVYFVDADLYHHVRAVRSVQCGGAPGQ